MEPRHPRSRWTRPLRRMRRWISRAPRREVVSAFLVVIGTVLVVVAIVLGLTVL